MGDRVEFCHPLVRLAIHQGAASIAERQRAHKAFAEVIDPNADPYRRAWHRAAASLTPDEDVATELEGLAAQAKGRADYATAAALLDQSAGLTPDLAQRAERTLAAVQAAVAAGALGRATILLDLVYLQPLSELERALAERLREAIALVLGQGTDRATALLRAAQAFEPLDSSLAARHVPRGRRGCYSHGALRERDDPGQPGGGRPGRPGGHCRRSTSRRPAPGRAGSPSHRRP